MSLPDDGHRLRALDPESSFIVQAPAGSGKTELLLQRYLRLLACVDQPEEVLAITFTRKAAGEIRERIVEALRRAAAGVPPAEPHLTLAYNLARDVIQDERRDSWQLQRHPSRLAISTIDSVNAWLAGRSPLCAGGGGPRRVTEAPAYLYAEAARATLALAAEPGEIGAPVIALLKHLDNDAARFERLIIAMLPRRDQWLRHVMAAKGDRAALEQPLGELVAAFLAAADGCLERQQKTEILHLMRAAGIESLRAGRDARVRVWAGLDAFPEPRHDQLEVWRALALTLLTQGAQWRRTVTVAQGFAPNLPEKASMLRLLAQLAPQDALRASLGDVAQLPGTAYEEGQWQILQQLFAVLPLAVAQLRLTFSARGEIDFVEVAAAAREALAPPDGPSELGLALDYRIRHILVDEFQDTSQSQCDLIAHLTDGWEPGDGRTIFIVGDPMQSIYRFREANVGLFLRVMDQGIGTLRPESLRLQSNFRSRPRLVKWINDTFPGVFEEAAYPHGPQEQQIMRLLGATRFVSSEAQRADGTDINEGVTWHWMGEGAQAAEAQRVVSIVRQALTEAGSGGAEGQQQGRPRVCVLVRSRSHAGQIIAALRAAGIAFVAPEIASMERTSVAQDLLALTRALTHPADRLAWIAVLRAPWCGLSLADLDALLANDHERPVPQLISDELALARLTADGRAAVTRMREVTDRASRVRGRMPLRDLVEGAWLKLGGPATLTDPGDQETAEEFLQLVESVDVGADCTNPVWLGEQMSTRKGSLGSGNPGVVVMTIHKAKGLEFDVVVLPGLARRPRANEAPVLAWLEVPAAKDGLPPILAPIGAIGTAGDPLHKYLMALDRRKDEWEARRLLYVACTRAREQLHLIGYLQAEQENSREATRVRAPETGSLLRCLWPVVTAEAIRAAGRLAAPAGQPGTATVWVQPLIRRLPTTWRVPDWGAPLSLSDGGAAPAPVESLKYEWVSGWARHAGSVVHRWLQIIAHQGIQVFDADGIRRLRPTIERMLQQVGTGPAELKAAADRVVEALTAAVEDERGRWILSGAHEDAENELPLTVCEGSRFRRLVVDRTFVTAAGERWIIDYKTSAHEGGDLDEFLSLEVQRYREQLMGYRDALSALDSRPVRAALYFPLLRAFREIDIGG